MTSGYSPADPSIAWMSVCIFCRLPFNRDRRRSDEHFWSRWMHGQLPDKPGAQRLFDGKLDARDAQPLATAILRRLSRTRAIEPVGTSARCG